MEGFFHQSDHLITVCLCLRDGPLALALILAVTYIFCWKGHPATDACVLQHILLCTWARSEPSDGGVHNAFFVSIYVNMCQRLHVTEGLCLWCRVCRHMVLKMTKYLAFQARLVLQC